MSYILIRPDGTFFKNCGINVITENCRIFGQQKQLKAGLAIPYIHIISSFIISEVKTIKIKPRQPN